ncbi:MAG: nucleotidyltransferase family protein [Deltaproteobacteria bacterium]|nr:nucleotidyltransferase family protein [Deltaproteobacteria bacterium]
MNSQIEEIKQTVLPILRHHGAKRAGLFGSLVREEMTEGSDIDILVELSKDLSLLDFVGIKLEIEERLGKKVDLVEYDTLKPLLKDRILKEEVRIL